jgi:hypothetical protein
LFLASRLAVLAFVLVTWAYCATSYSPFAFDMLIRPQLFPWLAEFVVWHHAWYWGAFVLSVLTLVPDFREFRSQRSAPSPALWMAAAYTVAGGAVGIHLLGAPYLPAVTRNESNYFVALVPLLPLVWLALIDHFATYRKVFGPERQGAVTGQAELLVASLATAGSLWFLFLGRAIWRGTALEGPRELIAAAGWSLTLACLCLAGSRRTA